MKILNFGSLNIDHVYRSDRIARPGETVASLSYKVYAGGKGANQSAALALAGARVYHAGKIGPDGRWLVKKLRNLGVETRHISLGTEPTGHALIQVDARGENAIVLYPGANHALTRREIDRTLAQFSKGDALLLQNETNELPYLILQGRQRGMKVIFNPAPFKKEIRKYPLHLVHTLAVNETELLGLAGCKGEKAALKRLTRLLPRVEILLTLGGRGALHTQGGQTARVAAHSAKVVDTTAAGDTFLGYYLAALAEGRPVTERMTFAARAAALCVSRQGTMDSIPRRVEMDG